MMLSKVGLKVAILVKQSEVLPHFICSDTLEPLKSDSFSYVNQSAFLKRLVKSKVKHILTTPASLIYKGQIFFKKGDNNDCLYTHTHLTMYYIRAFRYDIMNISLRFSHCYFTICIGYNMNCIGAVMKLKSDRHQYSLYRNQHTS